MSVSLTVKKNLAVKDIKRRLPFLTFYYILLDLRRQVAEPFRDPEYEDSVDVRTL
jgi:hypothetical protein